MKRKINDKGFTLVEILAVIVILGILLAIAIPAINNQLATFRLNYYSKLEDSVKSSGEDYIVDKRYAKPTNLLYSKVIKVETLEDEGYIDEVVDYLGNKCDSTDTSYSYVVVVKVGDSEYDYTACLKCSDDEYYTDTSGSENDYCNSAWLTNDYIDYETSYDDSDLYVYYGTTEEEIKPQVALTYNVIKYDSNGNVLKEVENTEDAIYPDNIGELIGKSVNSTVNLVYTLPDGSTLTKKATIYKHNTPSVTLTYNKANSLTGKSVGNTYTSGEWASSIKAVISFSSSDNSSVVSAIGMKTVEYYNGSSWVDTNCTVSNNKCTWTISSNFNKSIKFRIVNNDGMTSDTTGSYTIKVDIDSPTCTLASTSTLEKTSQTATLTCTDSYSGLSKYYWGTSSSGTPNVSISSNLSTTQSITSSGTYYLIGIDAAGNTSTASKTYYTYVVKHMLQKASGTAGTYNTSNYATYSTSSTYLAPSGTTLTSSSLYTKPTGSTYKGYSIGEPSTSNASVNSSGSASLTGNITVAYWFNRNSYTLTYNNQSGSGCSSVSKLYGDTWGTLCTPSRTGYTFNGWYTSTGGSGTHVTSSTTVSGDLTVYAYWTANTYTVTFNANGGSVSTSSKTVTYGSTYGTLPTPTKSGYALIGWYTSASGGTKITSTSTFTETSNQTLYAHWGVFTCTTSSTWSNTSGGLTITAESGKRIVYRYLNNDPIGSFTNPLTISVPAYEVTVYTLSLNASGSYENYTQSTTCYTNYDNLAPYTPVMSGLKLGGVSPYSETCSSLSKTSTSNLSCTITFKKSALTSLTSSSLSWGYSSSGDQSATSASGCSGINYTDTEFAFTYYSNYSIASSLAWKTIKITFNDYAGNQSGTLTVNFVYE